MATEKEGKRLDRLRFFNGALVAVLNLLLLLSAFFMYNGYNDAYTERLKEENLGNIANMNQSAALNITALFESWDIKLTDMTDYIERDGLTAKEALEFISETNTRDDWYFSIIGEDATGYSAQKNADGSFQELSFAHSSYSLLQKAFAKAGDGDGERTFYAVEYTDSGSTAEKFFAKYKYVRLQTEDGGTEYKTLMLSTPSNKVDSRLNSQRDYEVQSTVLIDASGNYIVSNRDFKSSNFFQYLYVYNDLTLDEKYAIMEEMTEKGSGELYFRNAGAVVEDCVYRYDRIGEDGWYCVTCVPKSSFREPAFNNSYLIYGAAMIIMAFVLDVIWLQGINRRLRNSARREREASAAKGTFMSRMSHEIRTPLNAIIGYNTIANSALGDAKTEGERRQAEMKVLDCLTKSDTASKHLLTIINDVLDMSAIESGRVKLSSEQFDFKGLITSITTVFYSQARGKGVDFSVVFETATDEWLVGDQVRTNQILMNLISNACKFTPSGGSVTLRIRQIASTDSQAQLQFEVTDTGIGMSEEYLSHIWAPFEQADSSISRRFGGTGLGLSITKNLVDLMGGEITVESEQERGTTFRVKLGFGRTECHLNTDAYDFSAIKALIVDDDIATCEYISFLFKRCGVSCVSATSGAEALELVEATREQGNGFSMCIVDWRMPHMDGIETVKGIRQIEGEAIPIIVLTAYDYSEIAERAVEAGVTRFISKPLFQSSLFDLLASISGAMPKAARSGEKKASFDGLRVLLVEDNEMNMEIAQTILEYSGVKVDGAWDGAEALEKFGASAPGDYDLILMDVHMPKMNGLEATRAIRSSAHPDSATIPIIAMTADAFTENVAEVLAAGMNDHIAKPIDVDMLFTTIRKYVPADRR